MSGCNLSNSKQMITYYMAGQLSGTLLESTLETMCKNSGDLLLVAECPAYHSHSTFKLFSRNDAAYINLLAIATKRFTLEELFYLAKCLISFSPNCMRNK